jgi:hypothetical protein
MRLFATFKQPQIASLPRLLDHRRIVPVPVNERVMRVLHHVMHSRLHPCHRFAAFPERNVAR